MDTKSRPSHNLFQLFLSSAESRSFPKSTHISKSPLKYRIISHISEISSYSIKNPQIPPPSEWPYFPMSLSRKLAQRPKIWILKVNRVSGQLSRNNKWVAYEVTKSDVLITTWNYCALYMPSFDFPPTLRICKKDNDNSSSYIKNIVFRHYFQKRYLWLLKKAIFIDKF